ncbi:adenylosuccinate lyase-like [Brassica napus]|uniref:adenylosuccinate lyase-like n=1 Tax=Brassica napus TaxID=3708 RepID=UPI0020785DA2|nr:adenylosuccinate lyase-like [Brassica napus]
MPEVLESAPHRLQSPSGIPRRRSQVLPISELHRDQASSSCSAVIDYCKVLLPLDGRYWGKVKDLASSMSEFGLIYFRVLVEIKWLIKLSKIPEVTEVPSFSKDAVVYLQGIIDGFSMDDALEVKKIERVLEFFHFACTSEYINNLSHGLMLREALTSVILPAMDDLIKSVRKWRFEEKRYLSETKIKGKFAGAVGNYNTHISAYPNIDWPNVAEEFVTSLGLTFNPYVTQPVNSIDFENNEGNLGKANAELTFLSMKLPISRMQLDLTDSTVLRNMGAVLGHSLLVYKSAIQGIRKLG